MAKGGGSSASKQRRVTCMSALASAKLFNQNRGLWTAPWRTIIDKAIRLQRTDINTYYVGEYVNGWITRMAPSRRSFFTTYLAGRSGRSGLATFCMWIIHYEEFLVLPSFPLCIYAAGCLPHAPATHCCLHTRPRRTHIELSITMKTDDGSDAHRVAGCEPAYISSRNRTGALSLPSGTIFLCLLLSLLFWALFFACARCAAERRPASKTSVSSSRSLFS